MMKTTGLWQTAALAGLLLLAKPAGAAEIGGGPALEAGAPVRVVLQYRELSNSIATWSLAFDSQTQPFVREPAGIGGTVHRGLIKLR